MFGGLSGDDKLNIQKVCAKFTTVYLKHRDNTTQKTPQKKAAPAPPHTLKRPFNGPIMFGPSPPRPTHRLASQEPALFSVPESTDI